MNNAFRSCCHKAIGDNTIIRKGRAHYVCPECGEDVTLILVFMHMLELEEEEEDHG